MKKAEIKSAEQCALDLVSVGEVMLRLDPGETRIHTTRGFRASEGGGEYNVARGLRRCFGQRTAIVTALVDNPVGRLVEDLILQGGVDPTYLKFVEDDGMGRRVRNGLNFTERGFGPRGGVGCSDRGHTAVSQMKPGDVDWKGLMARGVRWLHTGGIFSALSSSCAETAHVAMTEAQEAGTYVSYDLNYRPSLWRDAGGMDGAREVNRKLVSSVDVLFGNEEDFRAALGFELEGVDESYQDLPTASFRRMISDVVAAYPNLRTVATTLRTAHSASVNGWGAICYHEGEFYEVEPRDFDIMDRVGGGDSFASGFIYGMMTGESPQWALECGVAHGALAMSTPGDTTMARLKEVLALMQGKGARIIR
ncbi:MAG: sugar kinase [Myxococcota bacterium]